MFNINPEIKVQIDQWLDEQNKKAVEMQKNTIKLDDPFYYWYQVSWDCGSPYLGAIGGGEKTTFTPTKEELRIKVYYPMNQEELCLSQEPLSIEEIQKVLEKNLGENEKNMLQKHFGNTPLDELSYIVLPTSIGSIIQIENSEGTVFDITDYDSW